MAGQLQDRLDKILAAEAADEITIPVGTDYSGVVQMNAAAMPHIAVAGNPGTEMTPFVQTLMAEMMLKYPPSKVQFMIYDSTLRAYERFRDTPYVRRFVERDAFGPGLEAFLNSMMKPAGGEEQFSADTHVFLVVDRLQDLQLREAFGLRSILINGRKQMKLHGLTVADATAPRELFDLFLKEICHISFCMDSACGRAFMNESMTGALDATGEILCKWSPRYNKCRPMLLTEADLDAVVEAVR